MCPRVYLCLIIDIMVHKSELVNYRGSFLTTIGDRLKSERMRLAMSQTALASVGGVGKTTQINYEKGLRNPDATYLAAVAGAGVDVLYVVTGQSSMPSVAPPIDASRMVLIVERLESIAQGAGKFWPARQLVSTAVEVYNFLLEEETVDDTRLDRVLHLVVNR